MRVFALSDVHVDYEVNARWVDRLSFSDHSDDVLILAGDISDRLERLSWCIGAFAKRFRQVLFVPGNHELWVIRDAPAMDSIAKFRQVAAAVTDAGASMQPYRYGSTCIVPLLGWYDYSFGHPDATLHAVWMDYLACRWPDGMAPADVHAYFRAMNPTEAPEGVGEVITFSHFMPRIDLFPASVPADVRRLFPVLGASSLDEDLRRLGSRTHVYGHSHLNRRRTIDGVTYVNNAFGYPHEERIASKQLVSLVDLPA